MKVFIQIVLIGFLLLAGWGVWKIRKPLAKKLRVRESFFGMLAYFIIHFLIIIGVVILFKMLMVWMVKQYQGL